jgi:hypothetical protein
MNNERGVILLVTVLVITVVSIYLGAYAIWSFYDQRNLIRYQQAKNAYAVAVAGIEQAKRDLFQDGGSWLDGDINGIALTAPAANSPDDLVILYNGVLVNSAFPNEGSYTVNIKYLQNPKTCLSGCVFYDRKLQLVSTGMISGDSVTVKEIVSWDSVRNLGPGPLNGRSYVMLEPAIGPAAASDILAVTEAQLNENINISASRIIQGCYDPDFNFRNCMNYPTRIRGDLANPTVEITGAATNVRIGGVIIE